MTIDILNQVIGKIRDSVVQLEPSCEGDQITTYFNVSGTFPLRKGIYRVINFILIRIPLFYTSIVGKELMREFEIRK